MKQITLFFIQIYQNYISPLKGKTCRFYPTCSDYSKQSIEKFGFFKGSYLSIIRILKCHPFHRGGIDKVPDTFEFIKQKKGDKY